jgi:hypothetical protein
MRDWCDSVASTRLLAGAKRAEKIASKLHAGKPQYVHATSHHGPLLPLMCAFLPVALSSTVHLWVSMFLPLLGLAIFSKKRVAAGVVDSMILVGDVKGPPRSNALAHRRPAPIRCCVHSTACAQ